MADAEAKKLAARLRVKKWREENPERAKAAAKKSRAAKPEKYRMLHAEWRNRNKDRIKVYRAKQSKEKRDQATKDWIKANPERRREIANNWRKNNPEKVNAVAARRRASKLHAMPRWANQFFINEAYHLARLRTKMLGYPWHVDHVVPLQSKIVCGLHVEHNLRVVPAVINQSKNNRHWPDMP